MDSSKPLPIIAGTPPRSGSTTSSIISGLHWVAAATFAKRLMLPVSHDTLLRVVRRRGSPRFVPPTVIGINDWTWRRNQRYGTIICDLGRRKTIALLPDREPSTAQLGFRTAPRSAS